MSIDRPLSQMSKMQKYKNISSKWIIRKSNIKQKKHSYIQSSLLPLFVCFFFLTLTDIVYICLIYVTSGISSLYKNAQRPSELSKYVRSLNMNHVRGCFIAQPFSEIKGVWVWCLHVLSTFLMTKCTSL